MDAQNRIQPVSTTQTMPRQTPNDDFGAVMARTVVEVARTGGAVLSNMVGAGPVLSAATSSVASMSNLASGVRSIGSAQAMGATGSPGAGRQLSNAAGDPLSASKGEQWDLMEAQKLLNSQSQSFNLAYMQLQDGMQKESREFNTLTNIMKVRHDSAKAAINNIR
ncbi:MAG: hypothetical protein ACT4TC_25635 [Myxococcaceae bacterium]